jgi:hypothetical protein
MTRSEFSDFIATRRSLQTKQAYTHWARLVVGDPDKFIALARTEKQKAEQVVADFIVRTRSHAGGNYISAVLTPVKSFLDYYDVPFSWRRLKPLIPPPKFVASDRAPEILELRRMWAVADPRERLLMSMLASLGGRRGAFWFPSARQDYRYMALKDVTFDGDGPASLTVYPGEPEEYKTLISPEAVAQLRLTLELRQRVGEKLTPESPVMRTEWIVEYKGVASIHPEDGQPVEADWISGILRRLKLKAGITTNSRDGGFKAAHGFRKFFRSNFPPCPLHGDLEAEVLMGHKRAYEKVSWDHIKERYMAAVPHLSIDERFSLKEELSRSEQEHESQWTKVRIENLENKEKVRELEKNQAKIFELLRSGAKVDPRLLDLKPEDVGNG